MNYLNWQELTDATRRQDAPVESCLLHECVECGERGECVKCVESKLIHACVAGQVDMCDIKLTCVISLIYMCDMNL